MISHKYKLIFVHIPKCAGTSIENALGHYDGHTAGRGGQDHRNIRMIEKPLLQPAVFTSKENLKEVVRRLRYPRSQIINENNRLTVTRKQYNEYYKFTIVRNPWARAHSWFKNVMKDDFHQNRLGISSAMGMTEFLKRFADTGMLRNQIWYLQNFKGEIPMDFIGRFESLAADFEKVCQKLNISNVSLPHKIQGVGGDYREAFDQEAIDLIATVYREEIELFNYRFENE